MKILSLIAVAILINCTGCVTNPTTGVTTLVAPTTQQVEQGVALSQVFENEIISQLEAKGTIKSKSDAKVALIQNAVNAATTEFDSDLAKGWSYPNSLLDAAATGSLNYVLATQTTP